MKKIAIFGIVAALGSANVALAANSPFEFGVKGGLMMNDVSGFDSAMNAGVVVGYPINDAVTVEGEFTTSLSDGGTDISGVNWSVQTLAVYGVFKSKGDTYFKGKLGYLNESVSIDTGYGFSVGGDDSGLSYGIGGGMKLGSGSLEVEYTIIEADVNFLSIGYKF